MIIDAKTISITLIVVVIAFVWGLKFIRQFALQIAQENHDAVAAMDQQEEQQRLKKERAADDAAAVAFAKVEPLLTVTKVALPKSAPPKLQEQEAASGEMV
jgi:cytoskeletal protein RodZ